MVVPKRYSAIVKTLYLTLGTDASALMKRKFVSCLPSQSVCSVNVSVCCIACPIVQLDHAANTTTASTEMLEIPSLEQIKLNRTF